MDIRETSDFSSNFRRHFWEIARFKFVRKLIDFSITAPKRMLDIGCGDCFVLHSLTNHFPNAEFIGVDTALTEDMIKAITLRNSGKQNIFLYQSLDMEMIKKVDLILLLDVLEHIENEEDFLRSLHNVMHPGSKIIITVPAFQKLFTDHDRFLKHFRRYNRMSLLHVLEKSGFQVNCSGYIFCSLLPFRVMQKLLRIKSSQKENLRAANIFINTIATILLNIDSAVCFALSRIKIYIPGLSCFATAELKQTSRYDL